MAEENGDALPLDKRSALSPPSSPKLAIVGEDSDPDFDDLDDVLDQFSTAQDQSKSLPSLQPQQPIPEASGPGRPSSSDKTSSAAPPPLAPQPAESEDDFMARLATEMSSVLGNMKPNPDAPPEDVSKLANELDEFTSAMEKSGVKPEDLLKALMSEATLTGTKPASDETTTSQSEVSTQKPTKPDTSSGEKESFEETIRRTMQRMQASDSNATTAATAPNPNKATNSEEDMLATLLKAMETGGGGDGDPNAAGSEDSLSKMFLGMMEQLTNKDMLYEPMKELDTKYPDWLASNQAKLPEEDYRRYEGQRGIVREIVAKFEEKGYSDEDSRCREFVWERMQKMQDLGSPPEDLIANPIPGMMGSGAGGKEDDDVGCPAQ